MQDLIHQATALEAALMAKAKACADDALATAYYNEALILQEMAERLAKREQEAAR